MGGLRDLHTISLLPPEIRQQQQSRRKELVILLGALLVLCLALTTWGLLTLAVAGARSELQLMTGYQEELEGKVAALKKYEDQQNQINQLADELQVAFGTSPDWERLMVDIGLNIPEGIWFTDFVASYTQNKQEQNEGYGELTIRGWAQSNLYLMHWFNQMKGIPWLAGAECKFSLRGAMEDMSAIQFEIRSGLNPDVLPLATGGGIIYQ